MTRLESRAWSCASLLRGAAEVVDMAQVVKQEQLLLGETAGMSAAEIESMLKVPGVKSYVDRLFAGDGRYHRKPLRSIGDGSTCSGLSGSKVVSFLRRWRS